MAEEQKTAGKGAERQRTASPETAEIRTEGKRKRRFRGLKIALGILLGLWLLVMLVLQLVLTDSFLTKTVNRFAADYVDGELKFGKISASAFRSFPNLNLEIEDALLIYPHDKFAAYDSTGFPHPLRSEGRHPQMDTLASFRNLSVSVDYMAALRSKINVHKATLDGARIFAHRYDSTAANWSILKFLSTEKTDTSAAPLPDITVGRVALTGNPHIVFTAPSDTLFAEITSKEIRFDGRLRLPDMNKSQLDLDIDALDFAGRLPADSLQVTLDRLSLRQKEDRYDIDAAARARLGLASLGKMDLPIELQAGVSFPEEGFSAVSVRDLYLKAATVELTGEGDVKLRPDSTYIRAEALIDDCKVSDVTAFLGTSILPDLKKLKTDANISLTALCDGWYIPADKTLPELVAEVSIPKSSLARRMVHPCRPTSPVTITPPPGLALVPEVSTPSGILPIPVVVIKTPSTWPLPATLVSPATMRTPASSAVLAMEAAILSSFSIGKPSSMTKAQVRYIGLAPMQARSLTVPQIDSLPISPPGNSAGETIKPSVDIAILPSSMERTAASSAVRSGLSKYFLKIS